MGKAELIAPPPDLSVRVLYNWDPATPKYETKCGVKICKGDVLRILTLSSNGWLDGVYMEGPREGDRGWIPSTFVERIEKEKSSKL